MRNSILVVLLVIVSFNVHSGVCRLANINYDEMALKEMRSTFGASVVRLYSKNRKGENTHAGSAFLIDADSGAYITAKHVITSFSDSTVLYVLHSDFPYEEKELPVRVVKTSIEHDIALLQITSLAALPLPYKDLGDINYREARQGEGLFAFGSGELDEENNIRAHNAFFSNWADNGTLMVVESPIVSGDSGGPLLDKYGRVTGIFKSKIGGGVATIGKFTPSIFLDEILLYSEPSNIVRELGRRIVIADIGQIELARSLETLSNFEIRMLTKVIFESWNSSETSIADNVLPLLICPLFHELSNRDMTSVALQLSGWFPRFQTARLLSGLAELEYRKGYQDSANKVGQLAIEAFTESEQLAAVKGYSSDFVGWLAVDKGNLQYKMSLWEKSLDSSQSLLKSLESYASAASTDNDEIRRVAYGMTGNVFTILDQPEVAVRAFAASVEHTQGLPASWVKNGFSEASERTGCNEECMNSISAISAEELREKIKTLSLR